MPRHIRSIVTPNQSNSRNCIQVFVNKILIFRSLKMGSNVFCSALGGSPGKEVKTAGSDKNYQVVINSGRVWIIPLLGATFRPFCHILKTDELFVSFQHFRQITFSTFSSCSLCSLYSMENFQSLFSGGAVRCIIFLPWPNFSSVLQLDHRPVTVFVVRRRRVT